MKKSLVALAVLGGVLSVSACTSDPINQPPGKYEKTRTSTDQNGTTVQQKQSTDVQYDENGNKIAVTKSKTTRDPKGLFNKKTIQSDETIEEEDNR